MGGANMNDSIQVVRKVFASGSPALSAFDYLLAHAGAAAFTLVPRTSGAVLAVEFQWADQRRNPFAAQAHVHHINFYLRNPILTAHPHLFDAATKKYGEVKSNSLDEYRLHLRSLNEVDALLQFLREQGAWPSHRHDRRFLAATFAPLTGAHFLRAAQRLASGFVDHPFDPSNKYDLLFDGYRLAPKAVFGLAASEALGFPVRPENFSGGDDTLSFRLLREHGYRIVGKDEPGSLDPALVVADAVRSLAHDLLMLEAHGDYAGAKKMLEMAVLRPQYQKALDRLSAVPVDIRPIFVTAEQLARSPGTGKKTSSTTKK